jgi:Mannosyltransferase putative
MDGPSVSPDLSEVNAAQTMGAVARSLPEPTQQFEGRGIVIPAGGARYFPSAYASIRMLRNLGCSLPVELWHMGRRELDEPMRALVEPLGVRCVDATRVGPNPVMSCPGPNGGWSLKAFAAIHSRFREVLLLDADNLAVTDPTFLFDCEPFVRCGAVFWPDYGRFAPEHPVWKLTGVDYREEPEFESGQLLVDKGRCWRPLALAGWMNQHSDFWYRHIFGDKDTFHLAWRKLEVPYAMPEHPIETLEGVMCQHDFEGGRLFQHHNHHKWSADEQHEDIPGFLHLAQCFSYLDELKERWTNRPARPYDPTRANAAEREAAKRLCQTHWKYSHRGMPERHMRFQTDGRIGEGAGTWEQTWNVHDNGFHAIVLIAGKNGISSRMVEHQGHWQGSGLNRDSGAVTLDPWQTIVPAVIPQRNQDRRTFTPDQLRIAIATVPREPQYIHSTLASLFASDPYVHGVAGLHLFVGAPDPAYLDPYRHHRQIRIEPLPESDALRSAGWTVHRKACLNHYRCLSVPLGNARGLCVCEDDVVFCDDFIEKLLAGVREMEEDYGLSRYLLACYVPYRLDEPALQRGKRFASYPPHGFYGTQCMYYPKSVLAELAERVRKEGVESYTQPVDMIVKDFGIEIDGIYGTTRSLVQHVGRQTTGLGNFHTSPTFEGAVT